jgi:hypothetical protein
MPGSPVRLGAPRGDGDFCGCGRVIVRRGALQCGKCSHMAAGECRRERAERARVMFAQAMSVTEIAEQLGISKRDVERLLDPEMGHVQRPVERSVR